jgi:7,8-dihydropterin-6-yl-methyl-4-(beta-D-ribofuranosyl)aminobenzene 5'-phosphate synthase
LSIIVECKLKNKSKKILFDTGQSAKPVIANMKSMGLKINDIDLIVLSHCHYDHTGGLVEILKKSDKRIPVVAHPNIFRRNIVREENFRHVGIGASKEETKKCGADWILDKDPMKLMEGVITTGEIPKIQRVSFERDSSLNLCTIENGIIVDDDMLDDISLVIQTEDGLVILTGCSHAGIISIIERSQHLTGISKIVSLIGGYHLINADDKRIDLTINEVKKHSIDKIITGHCTGFRAECRFQRIFGKRFEKLHCGKVIDITQK